MKELSKLLKHYFALKETSNDLKNVDLLFNIIDLNKALSSKHLLNDEMVVLFCLYNLELNVLQTSIYLNKKIYEIDSLDKSAKDKILAVLNGYRSEFYQFDNVKDTYSLYYRIEQIRNHKMFIFKEISKKEQIELLEFLEVQGDVLSTYAKKFLKENNTKEFIQLNNAQSESDYSIIDFKNFKSFPNYYIFYVSKTNIQKKKSRNKKIIRGKNSES
jgi:hypothetical protein